MKRLPVIRRFIYILFLSALNIFLAEWDVIAQSWKNYPYIIQDSKIQFPWDEGVHPEEALEWWYANGHLTGMISGHQYSFMLAYFHKPVLNFDGFRILTITDETTQESSSQVLPCVYPILASDSLHILTTFPTGNSPEEWVNHTDSSGSILPFQYLIKASNGEDSIDLDLEASRPPLILGGDGFLFQGSNNYTYYYSLTNLAVNGSVLFQGFEENVSGIAWFDRQYGNFDPYEDESYEWFSIQLYDNMDLNIWNIFTPENLIPDTKEYRICSIIKDDTVSMTIHNFQIERLSFEFTPDSQRCYATSWRIISDTLEIDLRVEVNNAESELNISEIGMRFFEGSTKITGEIGGSMVSGVGFTELLHSYENPDLIIERPDEIDLWDAGDPMVWYIDNPDDGNPLKYDIEIEYESQMPFKVAGGLEDTVFYWNPSVFSRDTIFNINIHAYSSDSTLQSMVTRRFSFWPENTDLNACIGENIQFDLKLDKTNLFYKWFYNGQPAGFPEASVININPVKEGSGGYYKCLVYNEYFQDTTLEYHLIAGSCNQIENPLTEDVIIFPNPFKRYLNVRLPGDAGNSFLRIRNLYGKVIYVTTMVEMTNKIYLPNVMPGIYVIEIITGKNHKMCPVKALKW